MKWMNEIYIYIYKMHNYKNPNKNKLWVKMILLEAFCGQFMYYLVCKSTDQKLA